jgi:hypothetical protein
MITEKIELSKLEKIATEAKFIGEIPIIYSVACNMMTGTLASAGLGYVASEIGEDYGMEKLPRVVLGIGVYLGTALWSWHYFKSEDSISEVPTLKGAKIKPEQKSQLKQTLKCIGQIAKTASIWTIFLAGTIGASVYSSPIRTEVTKSACTILGTAKGDYSSEGIEYVQYLTPSGETGIAQVPYMGVTKVVPHGAYAQPGLPAELTRGQISLETEIYRGFSPGKERKGTTKAILCVIESGGK